jgi:ribulose-5-phosphate 4-epimerase/fuculose-1-phosphate aldolase
VIQYQLERYARLLADEQCVREGRIAICGQNDTTCCYGADDLSCLAEQILLKSGAAAVIVAEPLHPFPFFLIRRAAPDSATLVPEDSESKSSLHDIPVIRSVPDREELLHTICAALQKRKGCLVEGIGMVSQGGLTIEQAYIIWSSLMHATTIKYLADLLADGPVLPDESAALHTFKNSLKSVTFTDKPAPCTASLTSPQEILNEMCHTGQTTVRMGLVDSFFGNISWTTGDTMYISQTSARLDELAAQIDPVPFDESTTTGITASSELPAHKAIVKATGCRAILHGHPKFPVVMSFFSVPGEHEGISTVHALPVVRGEGGVGGLAESVPKAFLLTGSKAVIVQGHGVFAISANSFNEALATLADVEQQCREHYFLRLCEKYPHKLL